MENRSGLIVQTDLTQADGHAERRAAIDMPQRHASGSTRRLTLSADRGTDSAELVGQGGGLQRSGQWLSNAARRSAVVAQMG